MADEPEQERRRLAAMLPGADVVRAPGDADSPVVEMVALVTSSIVPSCGSAPSATTTIEK